jgi:hypothetical protein
MFDIRCFQPLGQALSLKFVVFSERDIFLVTYYMDLSNYHSTPTDSIKFQIK